MSPIQTLISVRVRGTSRLDGLEIDAIEQIVELTLVDHHVLRGAPDDGERDRLIDGHRRVRVDHVTPMAIAARRA